MNDQILSNIQLTISQLLATVNNVNNVNNDNMFDRVIRKFQQYYDRPVNSLTDMRSRNNTKVKGDIFEHFCLLYFKHCYSYHQESLVHVWLLKDIPDEIRDMLNLSRQDLGIDLVGVDKYGRYYAIQAKYRKRNAYKQKTGIPWKQLSTFYGIVSKTGPYYKHIVITNVDYVRHIGNKTIKDQSICVGTLKNITHNQWLIMSGDTGRMLGESNVVVRDIVIPKSPVKIKIVTNDDNYMRQQRLKRFES